MSLHACDFIVMVADEFALGNAEFRLSILQEIEDSIRNVKDKQN